MIKPGMIVRYKPEWCEPGEEKYVHVVLENWMNPVTNKMTRWLIQTVNSDTFLPPQEVVEEEMIEPIEEGG